MVVMFRVSVVIELRLERRAPRGGTAMLEIWGGICFWKGWPSTTRCCFRPCWEETHGRMIPWEDGYLRLFTGGLGGCIEKDCCEA